MRSAVQVLGIIHFSFRMVMTIHTSDARSLGRGLLRSWAVVVVALLIGPFGDVVLEAAELEVRERRQSAPSARTTATGAAGAAELDKLHRRARRIGIDLFLTVVLIGALVATALSSSAAYAGICIATWLYLGWKLTHED
jgi:hypothetical protein